MAAFEPFGGRSCNTSADLLQALISSKMPPGIRLAESAILPVDFATAWQILQPQVLKTKPDLVLLMGEKQGGSLTIESHARNLRRHGSATRKIAADKARFYTSKIVSEQLLAELPLATRQLFMLSENAGDYLCNFVYFMMLSVEPAINALFLHVPARSPQQFRKGAADDVKAVCDLIFSVKRILSGAGNNSDTKAIDGSGTNGMPRENQRRLLMADKHLVACEQEHEMITVLKHFKKGSSKENVDKMQNACRSWKKDSGAKYKPKNRDNFYKYLQEKGVLGKLS
ncbi:hypothetical protein [Turneriella parva]|nr:hypothetical protein [Turneriella parva]